MTETAKRNSNTPFWILLAVTGLPFLAAWIVFFNPSLMGDLSLGNKGELIVPSRPVPTLSLDTLDNVGFDTDALRDRWTMISVATGACGEDCQKNLYHMRQIRLAMGEDRSRVQRVLILEDAPTPGFAEKIEPFTGTVAITGPADARDTLLETLAGDSGDSVTHRVFLVDPQGNLMMSYPAAPPPKDVLKDLQRLLKVVQK